MFSNNNDIAQTITQTLTNWVDNSISVPVAIKRLLQAMHIAVNGGKRQRPILVILCSRLFNVEEKLALHTACALELIHCYSLVHDDLPAMDNDDMRRGQPTIHRQFDEATAILCGDALLTLAFEKLSCPDIGYHPQIQLQLIQLISRTSGWHGMIGGQAMDMQACFHTPTSISDILDLQARKTARLIETACLAGGILGQANTQHQQALTNYGHHLGLAYQIQDDLIDLQTDSITAGKRTGKDNQQGKWTIPAFKNQEHASQQVQHHYQQAKHALQQLSSYDCQDLHTIIDQLCTRQA